MVEGMGADVTILLEGVEPSSFAAAGDRLSLRPNSCFGTAHPGDL